MKLIVGLGNPGSKYIKTRHNLGFRVVSELAKRCNVELKKKLFGKAKEAGSTLFGKRLTLMQPLTFMNLSGNCVLRYADKFKVSLDSALIICDDINLDLGQIRIRPQGGTGGHNGLESIIKSLGTNNFPRLRIGIKTEEEPGDLAEYVLSDFEKNEAPLAEEAIVKAADLCECWIRYGIDKAMNLYNK